MKETGLGFIGFVGVSGRKRRLTRFVKKEKDKVNGGFVKSKR